MAEIIKNILQYITDSHEATRPQIIDLSQRKTILTYKKMILYAVQGLNRAGSNPTT